MKRSYVFPSVYEESFVDYAKVAENFIDGVKIVNFNQHDYLIGNMALNQGNAPHKLLNSSASELDYQLLALTSLIMATQGTDNKLVITAGFPFVTYPVYKKGARDFFLGKHLVSLDTRTFGGSGVETVSVNVDSIDVITEISGCIKAIREGQIAEKQNFFIGSLGFGSFELALSTQTGIVQRTAHSEKGINFAVNILENEIQKQYYINLLTEQQIERAFQRGYFVINRRKVDVTEMRKRALTSYFNEVISPGMRKKFLNEDFVKANKLYLVGGGAMYQELVDLFRQEFQEILDVIVYPDPYLCASEGYCLNSISLAQSVNNQELMDGTTYVGIDIGNSNTVVTVHTNSK
ncbi:MAG: ParM/StbA family protein [Bacteroidetes bacterium]|nr:ParM/StbA family protein [Bacteroidota bacterium]